MNARSRRRYLVIGLAGSLLCSALPAAAWTDPGQRQSAQPRQATFWSALRLTERPAADAWDTLRRGFALSHETDNPRVAHWLAWYRQHPHHVELIAEQARPWLHWVTQRLTANHLPTEIALLPFIESGYNPIATNPGGAAGLWQFMPATGDAMGLSRTAWYDGRRDVVAATNAAMRYLRQLADRWYDGDLLLALAAYNAGAGTVNAARDAAANRGEPIDYWHLRLPNETMNYIPRLLALAEVIAKPAAYDVALPSIPNRTPFVKVATDGPLTLSLAAELSGVDPQTLRQLNPGFKRASTRPREDASILVPVAAKQRFLANLAELPDSKRTVLERYVVRRGDTLSGIAARFATSVSDLRRENGLHGSTIRIGQALSVPARALASNSR
ncbi:LysM peptidoglycan-binding domain-containing protein [Salinicola endophyticus]|uniref:LysM peptidoglycan-binding domain-containing protein n=1 Tax=Salinicola endophyticus TaxID=1949083 RepID=A0ABY8FPZ9_9GAMM|nr:MULTISPECIES: transglycosylase SLT domain-containing protein [Salinicola]WFF42851.1 LysM peptidoglycan-binding domain-containing protein [Salinicola endophyticus]